MVKDEITEYDEDFPDEDEFESEEKELLEVLDEFDLEALISQGKDAKIRREIEFFDIRDQKKKKMPIYVRPITKGERNEINRLISRKNKGANLNKISLEERICQKGWLDQNGMLIAEISTIKSLPDGVADSIAEEINFVSGSFKNRFEDKYIDRVFGGS